MGDSTFSDEQRARNAAEIAQVIEDVIRRRSSAGGPSDAEIMAAHPEMMPELGAKLRALRQVEQAEGLVEEAGVSLGGTVTQAGSSLVPSDSFVGYQLLREVHRGGQGVVYQAIQKSTKRKVASVAARGPHIRR